LGSANALVVFTEVAAQGIALPATSNEVDRVLGVIAHRCKRTWARWSSGLLNPLVVLLSRQTRRATYEVAVYTCLGRRSYV